MDEADQAEESQSQNMRDVWMSPTPEPEVELTRLKPAELGEVLEISKSLVQMWQVVSYWCEVLEKKRQ